MRGTLQFSISNRTKSRTLHLEFDKVYVDEVEGGVRVHDVPSGRVAHLYEVELEAVARVGGGPTPQTALLVYALLEQKLAGES